MNQDTITEEQALKESTSSRGRGKDTGRSGRGRGRVDQNNNSGRGDQNNYSGRGRGGNQFDKFKIECYRCHMFGHCHSECYTKLSSNKENEVISKFVEENEAEMLLMAVQNSKEPKPDVWYVDTGCSNLMSGSKSSFSHLNEDFHSIVSFGDSSSIQVKGKGDIKIKPRMVLWKQSLMYCMYLT